MRRYIAFVGLLASAFAPLVSSGFEIDVSDERLMEAIGADLVAGLAEGEVGTTSDLRFCLDANALVHLYVGFGLNPPDSGGYVIGAEPGGLISITAQGRGRYELARDLRQSCVHSEGFPGAWKPVSKMDGAVVVGDLFGIMGETPAIDGFVLNVPAAAVREAAGVATFADLAVGETALAYGGDFCVEGGELYMNVGEPMPSEDNQYAVYRLTRHDRSVSLEARDKESDVSGIERSVVVAFDTPCSRSEISQEYLLPVDSILGAESLDQLLLDLGH